MLYLVAFGVLFLLIALSARGYYLAVFGCLAAVFAWLVHLENRENAEKDAARKPVAAKPQTAPGTPPKPVEPPKPAPAPQPPKMRLSSDYDAVSKFAEMCNKAHELWEKHATDEEYLHLYLSMTGRGDKSWTDGDALISIRVGTAAAKPLQEWMKTKYGNYRYGFGSDISIYADVDSLTRWISWDNDEMEVRERAYRHKKRLMKECPWATEIIVQMGDVYPAGRITLMITESKYKAKK